MDSFNRPSAYKSLLAFLIFLTLGIAMIQSS